MSSTSRIHLWVYYGMTNPQQYVIAWKCDSMEGFPLDVLLSKRDIQTLQNDLAHQHNCIMYESYPIPANKLIAGKQKPPYNDVAQGPS